MWVRTAHGACAAPRLREASRGAAPVLLLLLTSAATIALSIALPSLHSSAEDFRAITARRLERIAAAVRHYVADTGSLPGSLGALAAPPPAAEDWAGPYWRDSPSEYALGVGIDSTTDGWGRPFEWERLGDQVAVRSAGRDGVTSSGDDLRVLVDCRPVLLERNRWFIRIHATAARGFYAAQEEDSPDLQTDPARWYQALVSGGFLPSDERLMVDPWGRLYQPCSSVPGGHIDTVRSTSID